MIKTPLSTVIGGAFWTPGCTVIGGNTPTFDQQIQKLFANNEQGFAYDPNDLTTMFQDAAGTVPVTGAGQPVGLILDKSKGLKLGQNMAIASTIQGVPIGGSALTTYTVANNLIVGHVYYVQVTVSNYSGTDTVGLAGASNDAFLLMPPSTRLKSGNGIISFIGVASKAIQNIATRSTNTAVFENIQIREVLGNHAYQETSASRPILRDTPRRIDFDAVDDKLITNLPVQLSGCTVIRSVPNVGTQILTGQTIPAIHEDNTSHCGLIVINRALTPSETSAITSELNKRAGV